MLTPEPMFTRMGGKGLADVGCLPVSDKWHLPIVTFIGKVLADMVNSSYEALHFIYLHSYFIINIFNSDNTKVDKLLRDIRINTTIRWA